MTSREESRQQAREAALRLTNHQRISKANEITTRLKLCEELSEKVKTVDESERAQVQSKLDQIDQELIILANKARETLGNVNRQLDIFNEKSWKLPRPAFMILLGALLIWSIKFGLNYQGRTF
jgi:hypothetical protein